MSSQSFFWAHVGLAIVITVIFWVGRSRIKQPTRLNLRRGQYRQKQGRSLPSGGLSLEIQKVSGDEGLGIKNLNVVFIYNGHNFDAHEVLGVPAGSKHEQVEAAFKAALSSSSPQSRGFVEAAYGAISQSLGRRD